MLYLNRFADGIRVIVNTTQIFTRLLWQTAWLIGAANPLVAFVPSPLSDLNLSASVLA